MTLSDRAEREHAMAALEHNLRREMRRVVIWFASVPILAMLALVECVSPSWFLLVAILAGLAGAWCL